MGEVSALSMNPDFNDTPTPFSENKPKIPKASPMDTTNDGYNFNLGTLFKGWELYNDSNQTSVPTAKATAAGEKAGPNYLLIGGVALVAILLLRR